MGVHTWTGYVGYEKTCCEGIKQMLNLFCFGCHTSEDMGGCHRCEIGRANLLMLEYLEKYYKPNKYLNKLKKAIQKEEPYYAFLRLRSKFRPKRVSQKYIKEQKEDPKKKNFKKMGFMISHWAANNQECDRIIELLENIKKAKRKY